jgi:predicted RNase H-like nuclease (RuvC/YqgF family)
MSIYDSIDLRDRIKECQKQLLALNRENHDLRRSLEEHTEQTNLLRKEYNNIEHYEALEIYHTADEASIGGI